MPLPAPLLRQKRNVHKNTFGHVLILGGSPGMLGAGCLASLAALRTGAGLVTFGVPKSLNLIAQKKIVHEVMTLPLEETREQTMSLKAFQSIEQFSRKCQAVAVGPGMTIEPSSQKLVWKILEQLRQPLIIDADALNNLAGHLPLLMKTAAPKILTPHPGEMARLLGIKKEQVEKNRSKIARDFARKYDCVLLLKGYQTIVASSEGELYTNKTGNAGMATAGSGDVLTGVISALLAQGLSAFEAAKWGAYLHGKAGDLAAQVKGKASLIASDIIDEIANALK